MDQIMPQSFTDSDLTQLSIEELEQQVIFGEWQRLRNYSTRSRQRTGLLLEQLGYDPGMAAHRTVGVVGSKGKGTASAYASAALYGMGYRVGTVMSPGVLSNADRIRVNGAVLEETTRGSMLLQIERARRRLPGATAESGYLAPTGLFIIAAMLAFAEARVDVVVAEAGIGGRSDDLSHWPLDAVVLTEIFGEHLDLLGPGILDVARDKSAVITPATSVAVSLRQREDVGEVLKTRAADTQTPLVNVATEALDLLGHLPEGHSRQNAAAGVTAALQVHRGSHYEAPQQAASGPMSDPAGAVDVPKLEAVLQSVRYPGRLSTHDVLPDSAAESDVSRMRCVVDSAVSAAGLSAALDYSRHVLGEGPDQVLVCLPPGKDLPGFIHALSTVDCRRVFVELPGAYTGVPDRSEWPDEPGWEWISLEDLDSAGIHQTAGSNQLLNELTRGHTLAAGTVLFSSLVLRTLRAETNQLFHAVDPPEV